MATAGVSAVVVVGVELVSSEKAKAAGTPVEVGLSTIEWQSQPICLVNRSEQPHQDMASLEGLLADRLNPQHLCKEEIVAPSFGAEQQAQDAQDAQDAQNATCSRGEHRNLLVAIGICTHFGLPTTTFRPDLVPADLGCDGKGGFFCPCHGSKFDLVGRVFGHGLQVGMCVNAKGQSKIGNISILLIDSIS